MQTAVAGNVGNVPLELTSFVGRRREVTEAKRLLSVSRLVTLTGIGGVGKTRLAMRVGADSRRAFDDGVWIVELAELTDSSLLAQTVASALRLRDQSARSPLDTVIEHLAPRRLLLVLDNCEHVVAAVASLVEALLRACPELRILAASRESLGIGGEAVLRVPPLTVPDQDRPPSLQGLPRYEAMTLFAERAASAVPDFELTADNMVAVAAICRQLDGLPLPIELAAVRLRAMSAEQILHRLTDRYRLLTVGSRGAPTRQQTLRASIDWSYELCSPQEQGLWSRLAVFAGSFELDAAEGVCAGELTVHEVLDVVALLVEKSILIREGSGAVVRYRLLETLREYGREKLQESGEYEALHRRHHGWYERLARASESEWIGPKQVEWIHRLDREQPNLRDALHFGLVELDDEACLRIANDLYPFWFCRGQLSEGRRWYERALARHSGAPTAARLTALDASSVMAGMQGDLVAAAAAVEEGRGIAEQLGDPLSRARIAHASGFLAIFSGDLEGAAASFEVSIEASAVVGDLLRPIGGLLGLGLASGLLGDEKRSIECHEQVLAITEPRGESFYRAYSLWALGLAVLRKPDIAKASELVKQGLQLTRLVDDPLCGLWCLEALAWIAAAEHAEQRAAVLLGAAGALARSIGNAPVSIPNLLVHHDESERRTRAVLGERAFETSVREGAAMSVEDAVAFALGERTSQVRDTAEASTLTKRERQVADLVAQGMTNKAIAAQLVISQRTAQGHVEHVLAKLGFSSRAQIAAWVVERAQVEPR